jgi:hypothetical protein
MNIANEIEWEMIKASLPLLSLEELHKFLEASSAYIKSNTPHNLTFEQYKEIVRAQYSAIESCIPLMGPEELEEFAEELKKYRERLASFR